MPPSFAMNWDQAVPNLITALAAVGGSAVMGFMLNRREWNRVRHEIDEAHFQHRQGVYHQLVRTVSEVIHWGGHFVGNREWQVRWIEHSSAVQLFASSPVNAAFDDVATQIDLLQLWDDAGGSGPDDEPSLVDLVKAVEKFVSTARRESAPA